MIKKLALWLIEKSLGLTIKNLLFIFNSITKEDLHLVRKGTGVIDDFVQILSGLKEQPPTIHDIKLQFASNIHEELKTNITPNKKNGSIKLDTLDLDPNTIAKILVYPSVIQIDLGCTSNPIPCTPEGMYRMEEYLKKISEHINQQNYFILPNIMDWLVTHYHFGIDGQEEWNGKGIHYSIKDVREGVMRFYSKTMPNGKIVPRIEQIRTPNVIFSQLLQHTISSNKPITKQM